MIEMRMKPLYDNIRLNCMILADTHIDEKHPMPWLPMLKLKQALKDSENSKAPVDALVIVGDTTSRGSRANWEMTKECFKKYTPAKNILLAIGNHDTWNDDGCDRALEEYRRACADIGAQGDKKVYFSKVINGYHLIFLGSENDIGCCASISDEQLDWFEDEMKKADESGKPVFVFCHQSLNQRHGLPKSGSREKREDLPPWEDGVGDASDRIAEIMHAHKNVYYFSGHSHMGLCGEKQKAKEGYSSFETEGDIELINLPSLACGNHSGETPKNSIGVQLEVYENKVVIRPRYYTTKSWFTKVKIRNGKPYFEKDI